MSISHIRWAIILPSGGSQETVPKVHTYFSSRQMVGAEYYCQMSVFDRSKAQPMAGVEAGQCHSLIYRERIALSGAL